MIEIWKDIDGYEAYQVSNRGRVRSYKKKVGMGWHIRRDLPPTILSQSPRSKTCAYLCVALVEVGRKRRTFSVHKLVLTHFESPKPDGMQACHRDGDVTNNSIENLRWGTPVSNNLDKISHGTLLTGERVGTSRLTGQQVREIRSDRRSVKDIANHYSVCKQTVRNILNGDTYTCAGVGN